MFEKEIERAAAKAAEQARQQQREQAVAASTVSLRATLLQQPTRTWTGQHACVPTRQGTISP